MPQRTAVRRRAPAPAVPATPTSQLLAQGEALVARVRTLHITDAATCQDAVRAAQEIKEFLAKVEGLTERVVKAAHAAWQAAIQQRTTMRAPALEVDQHIRRELRQWEEAQQRQRAAALAEAERERARLEAAERARVAAAEAQARADAEVVRAREIAQAQAAGDGALVSRLRVEPVAVAPVELRPVFAAPVPVVPTVEGVTYRDEWTAEVRSLLDLVCGIAAGTVSLATVQPNQPVLNQMAAALKGQLAVPGVVARHARVPVVKRRA